MTTTPQAALLREAAQNALITLDGIADTNPRDTADFETPAEWIAWAKSRARWAADALRAPIAQEIYAERILRKMLHESDQSQATHQCGTCGHIGIEDPVKGCPKCGFDDMRAKLQATQEPVQAGELPDERAAFEQWWRQRQLLTFPKDYDQSRLADWCEAYKPAAKDAWQARAALSARKPLNSAQIRGMALQEQFLLVCDGLDELTCIVRAVESAILAKLQATQELVQAGSASLLDGCKSIMDSIAVSSSVIEHNKQEPVQAGELPPLPEPDSYLFQHDETGNTMFVDAQQVEWGFEKNNPRLHKIGGAFTEGQMHAYARAALSARKPLPYDLICNAIDLADNESMKADYMLDSGDCIAVVRTMQALIEINGIGLEVKP